MKRSEKLFLAINEIDERLIKNAKSEEQKPIEMKPEPRSPIKGIIALAACVAVLAVGVFALVKFKLNSGIEPAPIQNGSDSSISDSTSEYNSSDPDSSNDSSDSSPKIELTFTEEDLELQAILKDLTANATDIDSIFKRLSEQGEGIPLKIGDAGYGGTYYPITDGRKTEPSGLFTVPKTRSELEQLLLTCFMRRAVDSYMGEVGMGHTAVDNDGKTVLIPDLYRWAIFEADGRLFHLLSEYNDHYKFDVDCTTAQVKSKTDKTIRFTYYDGSGAPGETEGVIMFEDGGWKLDFFYNRKFSPELPTEFTEEDLELQNILNELSDAQEIFGWFLNFSLLDEKIFNFKFNGSDDLTHSYALVSKDTIVSASGLKYPQSCEELEELLPKYFMQKTVDLYMSYVTKGTMTENSDGTYTVTATGAYNFYRHNPRFIEIDGNMYCAVEFLAGASYKPIWRTAQITERTADSIKFTIYNAVNDEYSPTDGLIRYERGGWRLNYDIKNGLSTDQNAY